MNMFKLLLPKYKIHPWLISFFGCGSDEKLDDTHHLQFLTQCSGFCPYGFTGNTSIKLTNELYSLKTLRDMFYYLAEVLFWIGSDIGCAIENSFFLCYLWPISPGSLAPHFSVSFSHWLFKKWKSLEFKEFLLLLLSTTTYTVIDISPEVLTASSPLESLRGISKLTCPKLNSPPALTLEFSFDFPHLMFS